MSATDALAAAVRDIPDFPKPGILFKDITPILGDPVLLRACADALAEPFRNAGITHVAGIEARGFLLGGLLAADLGAGFVPVRKKGKLPWKTVEAEYALEYGTDCIQMHADATGPGDRVLIHDDVIATGGTAAAAADLIRQTGAEVVGYAFILEIPFLQGRARLDQSLPVYALLEG
ncbi:MAG: adenine phosphoribosyltransferase [Rhodothermales bacterium]|nr:adenine phosphoribosyltransferase [Rhodothermales bacterium]MCA0269455.1 adenine phosphoribosyltransferase [Bacteroidota bacterium]